MKAKVALYAIAIGIVAVGTLLYNHLVHGEAIDLGRLWLAMIMLPVFGFGIWLRWDWGPKKRREVRAERKAEKDAETFE